jgi:metal-responsive CopG/Arc/MetJ family transcriptional regulator
MRTTLEIDDDVLLAIKELSKRKKKSAGEIMSELARSALTSAQNHVQEEVTEYGFPVIPKKSDAIVTMEHINKLLEETDL